MKKTLKSFFLLALITSSALFSEHQATDPLQVQQPNWLRRVLSSFADDSPQRVLFYAPGPDGKDYPIQEVTYSATGSVAKQTDLTVLPQAHANVAMLGTRVVAHGMHVTYHSNGKAATICHYDHGLLDGPLERFDKDGRRCLDTHYEQGTLEGDTRWYNAHGVLAGEGHYRHGARDGTWVTYHDDGSPAAKRTYAQGLLENESTEWHPDGTVKARRHYIHGLLHGNGNKPALQCYHENGRLAENLNFRFGQPSGQHAQYHPNGKESYTAIYKEGRKDGDERWFDSEGAALGGGKFVHDKPVGVHTRYHSPEVMAKQATYDAQGRLKEPIAEWTKKGQKASDIAW